MRQPACKPGSVWRAVCGRTRDGHSSATPIAGCLMQPTRTVGLETDRTITRPHRPYLVLLPVGFAVPLPLPERAVGSYPTLSPLPAAAEALEGGLLSVALSLGSPPPGVTRHRVSMEPGLSSSPVVKRPSGRLAHCRDRSLDSGGSSGGLPAGDHIGLPQSCFRIPLTFWQYRLDIGFMRFA